MSGALTIMMTVGRGLIANTFDGTSPSTLFEGSIVGIGTATTQTCTVIVSGGSGSYTYSWTRISGVTSINISSATSASVTWSSTFGPAALRTNEWQCTVTDTVTGSTTNAPIDIVNLERTA